MTDGPKTILVLAASIYQLDAIRAAKRLGYRVVTVDNVPANPGHALADRSYDVDTTDLEGVLRVAKAENISGVLAACTDVAVPTAAYVSETMGLPGPPLRSARVLTSKSQFRHFLAEQGLPTPRALPVQAGFAPRSGLFSAQTWILKPDRSSGCKGTFIVRSEEELRQRLPETLSFSPGGTGVLEEFMDGHQGTCEGVIQESRIALSFLLDRQTPPPPYVTTLGHHCPTELPVAAQERVLGLIERVFKMLDVRQGVFDCDFVATAEEVFLLEVSPRPGGNSISGLLRRATGFDLTEYAVREACRDEPRLVAPKSMRPTAVLLLGVWQAGQLRYNQAEAERLRRERWVDSLQIDLPQGTPVQPFINGRHRVGEAFVTGTDRADLDARVIELKRRLAVRSE
jgi:biotin carboxylase